jgi:hypothetical protein
LNRRSFTAQENAELSEILTVQKNARALVSSSAEVTQEGGRLYRMQERQYEALGRRVRALESALVMPSLCDCSLNGYSIRPAW